jgi:hypothetical protein
MCGCFVCYTIVDRGEKTFICFCNNKKMNDSIGRKRKNDERRKLLYPGANIKS